MEFVWYFSFHSFEKFRFCAKYMNYFVPFHSNTFSCVSIIMNRASGEMENGMRNGKKVFFNWVHWITWPWIGSIAWIDSWRGMGHGEGDRRRGKRIKGWMNQFCNVSWIKERIIGEETIFSLEKTLNLSSPLLKARKQKKKVKAQSDVLRDYTKWPMIWNSIEIQVQSINVLTFRIHLVTSCLFLF